MRLFVAKLVKRFCDATESLDDFRYARAYSCIAKCFTAFPNMGEVSKVKKTWEMTSGVARFSMNIEHT